MTSGFFILLCQVITELEFQNSINLTLIHLSQNQFEISNAMATMTTGQGVFEEGFAAKHFFDLFAIVIVFICQGFKKGS